MLCVFLGNVVFLLCGGCMRFCGWAWVCVCVFVWCGVCVGCECVGVYIVRVFMWGMCVCVCVFVSCIPISTGKRHFTCLGTFFVCCESIKSRQDTEPSARSRNKRGHFFNKQSIKRNVVLCGCLENVYYLENIFLTCIQLDVFNLQTPLETKYTFLSPPNKTNKNNQYLF